MNGSKIRAPKKKHFQKKSINQWMEQKKKYAKIIMYKHDALVCKAKRWKCWGERLGKRKHGLYLSNNFRLIWSTDIFQRSNAGCRRTQTLKHRSIHTQTNLFAHIYERTDQMYTYKFGCTKIASIQREHTAKKKSDTRQTFTGTY